MRWFKVLKIVWKVTKIFAKIKEAPQIDAAIDEVEQELRGGS